MILKSNINYAKKLLPWLVIIMFLRLVGFSAFTESPAIAKVIKIILGLSMTTAIVYVFQMLVSLGHVASFKYQHQPALIFYVLYLSLGLSSLLWTSDLAVSALQIVRDIEMLVFGFFLTYTLLLLNQFYPETPVRLSSLVAPGATLNLLIFVVGNMIWPDVFTRMTHGGEVARLGGQIMNPNELGMLSGVTIAASYVELKNGKNKFWFGAMVIVALITLVQTGSRSSMIGFFLITLFYIRKSDNKLLKTGVIAGMVLALPVIVNVIFLKVGAGNMEEILSMTGRIPFWTALLTEGLPREPLLGFGFMRINYTTYFQGANTYPASMTHNTFIQVLMNLGLIGFSIVFLQMIFMGKAVVQSKDSGIKDTVITMLIPLFINSITEFGIWGEVNYSILFYQLLILSLVVRYKNQFSMQEKVFMNKKLGFGRQV